MINKSVTNFLTDQLELRIVEEKNEIALIELKIQKLKETLHLNACYLSRLSSVGIQAPYPNIPAAVGGEDMPFWRVEKSEVIGKSEYLYKIANPAK